VRVKVLRYLAAMIIVAAVFVGGGMAAASAQDASMQTAMAEQAAQQAALGAALQQNVSGVQARPPGAVDRCEVGAGGSCSTGQGITFTILPPGATPPPTVDPTPPDDGGGDDGGGVGGDDDGDTPGATPPTGLVKTGPSATGWAAIIGLVFVQLGMVVLIRGSRWTRFQMSQLG